MLKIWDLLVGKLPAIKFWEWFDPMGSQIQADWFEWGQGQVADFFFWELQIWQLVTSKPSNLKILYLQHWKI